jgi:lysophospholipid acyltransferase
MATFVVSAFWHGFYPSYYVMFVYAAVLSEVNYIVFKSQTLFKQYIPKVLIWPVCLFLNMSCMNYFGIVFCALTLENTWFFLKETYAFVYIGLTLFMVYASQTKLLKRAAKLDEKLKQK